MPETCFGKYTGIVKDNRDDQKLGHLKVFVPAIFPADDEEDVVIARPALPYGFYFVPEKDAKVWVEFEGGIRIFLSGPAYSTYPANGPKKERLALRRNE